jgi:hypothetical protein
MDLIHAYRKTVKCVWITKENIRIENDKKKSIMITLTSLTRGGMKNDDKE